MVLPTGLLIGQKPHKPTHRVGRVLGKGACGSVHELEALDGSSSDEYVVKIVPLPPPKKNPKKKATQAECNANLLNYENVLYAAQFNSLYGKYVPNRPPHNGPPAFGDKDGFRFLVMERMDAPLSDVVKRLMESKKSRSNKIPFGVVAAALLDCIHALHDTGHLFVDVKPENFMLSPKGKTLASQIRMIDFGLVQQMGAISGHRPNEGTSSIVGTPLYASLNAHAGQTHSRRDDLEALGYIIGELLMKIVAATQGKSKVELPWSKGTSDEDIGRLKEREMTSTSSTFFDSIGAGGNEAVEQSLREYFQLVRDMDYKTKPNYDALRTLLSQLDVVAAAKKAPRKRAPKVTKPAAAAPKSTSKRTTRARAKRSDDEDVPPKYRRVDDEEEDFESAYGSVPDDFATAREDDDDETEPMDWEPEHEEDASPDENIAPKPRRGVKLLFTDGPYKDYSLELVQGQTEAVYMGSDPTAKEGGTEYDIPDDPHVDETHVKFELQSSKHMQSVEVTDLSSTGTFVNNGKIRRGKDTRAFLGDTVRFGDSTIKIKPLTDKTQATETKKATAKMPAVVKTRNETLVSPLKEEPRRNAPDPKSSLRIVFTEGPHKNESIILQKGGTERLVLGSNPKTPKSGTTMELEGVDASHLQLDLVATKKLCSLDAKDLKSSTGTFVNGGQMKSGKEQRVFRGDSIQIGNHVMQVKPLL